MKTLKLTAIIATLILLTTVSIKAKEKKAKISNTRTASCLVKITAEPDFLPLDFDNVDYLLHSSNVYGDALREVLNYSPDSEVELFHMRISATKPATLPAERIVEAATRSGGGGRGGGRGASVTSNEQPATTGRRSRTTRSPSYRGRRVDRTAGTQITDSQTLMFELEVKLPEGADPLAEEFLVALTNGLRNTLDIAYDRYKGQLESNLGDAESQLHNAKVELSKTMVQNKIIVQTPLFVQELLDASVIKQLDGEVIDLAELTPQTPFDEAINQLTNSVDPPLKIFVNWGDLYTNADIDQTEQINMDAIRDVSLRKGLELILASVSGGFAEIGYVVEKGVITIATEDSLPKNLRTGTYTLSSPINTATLVDIITETVEPESWFDNGGEGKIRVFQNKQLIITQTNEVHQEILKLLQSLKISNA